MNLFIGLVFIVFAVYAAVTDTTDEEIQKYVKQRRGTLIETERVFSFFSSKSSPRYYVITYRDRSGKLHKVSAKATYDWSKTNFEFYDDMVVGTAPPEKRTSEADLLAEEKFTWKTYKCGQSELQVLQEFHNPNPGERVLMNGAQAPNGKYKLGMLKYIHVVSGRISSLSSF
ncbi:MAG: hypothetical protein JST26_13170 [Bacteroidetes bacterium]|nr:hypothetical protein [Bacteroidota bacterium]